MSNLYTPGLQVSKSTRITKVRELPLPGTALVKVGARVKASDAVLSAERPGDLTILRIADRMGLEANDIPAGLKVKVGDTVQEGQLLCEVKTFFGFFTSRLTSPVSGVVEFFTEANAHLGVRHAAIPFSVAAYISGEVTAVEPGKSVTIETTGAFIQGIFGVGGESHGTIECLKLGPTDVVTKDALTKASPLTGKILLGGRSFAIEALRYAAESGAQGVVTGSIDSETLTAYVGKTISVSVTGDENVPFPLVVTEGFGSLPMSERILKLAGELHGRAASINGTTQVRAGAMRPEIVCPMDGDATAKSPSEQVQSSTLEIGKRIRIIRVPHFGRFATVTGLPHEPQTIDTGAAVRVLQARLEDGSVVTVPRANVELA